MSKPSKRKDKVPKITEEEYAAYISSLKVAAETQPSAQPCCETETKKTE